VLIGMVAERGGPIREQPWRIAQRLGQQQHVRLASV